MASNHQNIWPNQEYFFNEISFIFCWICPNREGASKCILQKHLKNKNKNFVKENICESRIFWWVWCYEYIKKLSYCHLIKNCPHIKYRQFFQPNLEDRKEIEIIFENFRPLNIVPQKKIHVSHRTILSLLYTESSSEKNWFWTNFEKNP